MLLCKNEDLRADAEKVRDLNFFSSCVKLAANASPLGLADCEPCTNEGEDAPHHHVVDIYHRFHKHISGAEGLSLPVIAWLCWHVIFCGWSPVPWAFCINEIHS